MSISDELAKLIHIDDDGHFPDLSAHVIPGLYRVAGGSSALREALDEACRVASAAIAA